MKGRLTWDVILSIMRDIAHGMVMFHKINWTCNSFDPRGIKTYRKERRNANLYHSNRDSNYVGPRELAHCSVE